jgi:glycogen debranching enzyme
MPMPRLRKVIVPLHASTPQNQLNWPPMNNLGPQAHLLLLVPAILLSALTARAQSLTAIPAFPFAKSDLVISRPTQPQQPFTVAGPRGVIVGSQDGQFESWILPIKLLRHLTIEANLQGYSVPIEVNPQSANIEVHPDRTVITYSHIAFTLRQIMFSPDLPTSCEPASKVGRGFNPGIKTAESTRALAPEVCSFPSSPSTGPVVLFQIDAPHPLDLTFRFTPEMRWMWPKRNEGIPSAEWVKNNPSQTKSGVLQVPPLGPRIANATDPSGYYVLHMDYPNLAGAVTIPTAAPGILAPYQERPQVHPLELHLHYDPKRDGTGEQARFFPLLMAAATTKESASAKSLGESLAQLNASIPEAYKAHAASYEKLLAESTSIETPDKALNKAFKWGIVSIEQLKAHEYTSNQDALVAGYYSSGDSARPGFGWFFGRDSLYTLYAVNCYGDFALTRAELEFLIARQRPDGKIMHEFSQTAADPSVDWKSFPYMYAAADATPLFLMAVRDYYRASNDLAFLQAHKEAIEKAWAFETAPSSDADHDGIYDNSQGTGWVESWPADPTAGSNNVSGMPHQEIYLALLDEQASQAYAALQVALGDPSKTSAASSRANKIRTTIESEYYDSEKGCYAFATNPPGTAHSPVDHTTTVYPAIAWWDYNQTSNSTGILQTAEKFGSERGGGFNPRKTSAKSGGALAPEGKSNSTEGTGFSPDINHPEAAAALAPEGNPPLAHPQACLQQFASPTLATDWGLRDLADTEPFYDGMSYHQGSVWPLFTGWAALAEYRANQPLAGEQMLMQNVDLTWAQDPAAVTELLSGDYFVSFGRSTSHQLWSSAMVLTPTLRGLFGINLDAATNTITVNPHLPAQWTSAKINNLHIGNQLVELQFAREKGYLSVIATAKAPTIHLRSDVAGSKLSTPHFGAAEITIPLPPAELELPTHALPAPGSRPGQIKVLSTELGPRTLTVRAQGQPETNVQLVLHHNLPMLPKIALADQQEHPDAMVGIRFSDKAPSHSEEPMYLSLHFPKGQGWQTLEFTLTW